MQVHRLDLEEQVFPEQLLEELIDEV